MANATATRTRKKRQTKATAAEAPAKAKGKEGQTREVLAIPFKVGDTITLTSGTTFTSTSPKVKGRQQVKRAHQVVIADVIPARVAPRNSEKGSKVLVRPPRIRAKGSGGYFKDVTLTESLVRHNGKTPTFETISLELDPEKSAAA